jgi:rubredoxin
MTLAGEGAGADVGTKRRVRSEPAQQAAPTAGAPYWKCSGCKYVLQAAQPPETCPSCREHCQFVDVSCYIPECGFTGADARLV